MSDESTLAEAKRRLRSLNVRAAKGLGQHFLIDRGVLDTIMSAAGIDSGDVVVEVGPGLGMLTEELVRRAGRVIAVEVDSRLAQALGDRLRSDSKLVVLNADVLDLDPEEMVAGSPPPGRAAGYKVVANLPYYVAAPILRHFLEARLKPRLMVVMVQKEVAQSMAAGPGRMSLLGISVQLYGRPQIVGYVPARSFHPQPKVESAVVRIEVYPEPAVDVADVSGFFDVVRAGFRSPRKQIRNSLSIGLGRSVVETVTILEDAGIDPSLRPQTLSLEEWAAVYRVFSGREAG